MSLLIIGTADDGADNLVVQPTSLDALMLTYYPKVVDIVNVTATQTSATLSATPWNDVTITPDVYNPQVAGNTLTFGQVGSATTLTISYNSVPRVTDFHPLARLILNTNYELPSVIRIGGNKSTANLGGIKLVAQNSGVRLNTKQVVVTTGNFQYKDTNNSVRNISFTNPANLVKSINQDNVLGRCAFTAILESGSISNGTYTFSGGTAGDLTNLVDLVSNLDFETIDGIILPQGTTGTQINAILSNLPDEIILFVGSSPVQETLSNTDYISALADLEVADPRVFVIPGWCDIENATRVSLAPLFAAIFDNQENRTPAFTASQVNNVAPQWTTAQVDSLSINTCPWTLSVSAGWTPFCASTTDGGDGIRARLRSDIASKLKTLFLDAIGHPVKEVQNPEAVISAVLDTIPTIRDYTVSCDIEDTQITANISVRRWGEIRSMNFTFNSRT